MVIDIHGWIHWITLNQLHHSYHVTCANSVDSTYCPLSTVSGKVLIHNKNSIVSDKYIEYILCSPCTYTKQLHSHQ